MNRKPDNAFFTSGASSRFRSQLKIQMIAVAVFGLVALALAAWRVLACVIG